MKLTAVFEALRGLPLRQTIVAFLAAMIVLTWLVGLFGADEVLYRFDALIGIPQQNGVTP